MDDRGERSSYRTEQVGRAVLRESCHRRRIAGRITGVQIVSRCQFAAINAGKERGDVDVLKKVYDTDFKLLHPSIKALENGTKEGLLKCEGYFPKAYIELERTGRFRVR